MYIYTHFYYIDINYIIPHTYRLNILLSLLVKMKKKRRGCFVLFSLSGCYAFVVIVPIPVFFFFFFTSFCIVTFIIDDYVRNNKLFVFWQKGSGKKEDSGKNLELKKLREREKIK